MLAFGIIGYFMKVYGFQVAPVILGVILGPLMDVSYRRAMISVRDDVGMFFLEFLTHPLSLILTLSLVFILLAQTPAWTRIFGAKKSGANPHRVIVSSRSARQFSTIILARDRLADLPAGVPSTDLAESGRVCDSMGGSRTHHP